MSLSSNFMLAARKEREKLTELYNSAGIIDYLFTKEDGFDSYDSLFKKDGKNYIVETKVRNNKMDDSLFTTGYILEKYKYDKLVVQQMKMIKSDPSVLYINFFRDGYIIFDLTPRISGAIHMNSAMIKCNKTTAVVSSKVDKSVYLLSVTGKDKQKYITTSTQVPTFTSPIPTFK